MRVHAKGTIGSFGGRKLIYNKIITRKIYISLKVRVACLLNVSNNYLLIVNV